MYSSVTVTYTVFSNSSTVNFNGYEPTTPFLIFANCAGSTATFGVKSVPSAFPALTSALFLAAVSVKAFASSSVTVKFLALKNLDLSGEISVFSSTIVKFLTTSADSPFSIAINFIWYVPNLPIFISSIVPPEIITGVIEISFDGLPFFVATTFITFFRYASMLELLLIASDCLITALCASIFKLVSSSYTIRTFIRYVLPSCTGFFGFTWNFSLLSPSKPAIAALPLEGKVPWISSLLITSILIGVFPSTCGVFCKDK